MSKFTKVFSKLKSVPSLEDSYLLQFDGLASPNPGKCTAGAVCFSPKNLEDSRSIVFEAGKYLGHGTNNQGEYMGVLIGLHTCAKFGIKRVYIEGDSMLVTKQVAQVWKINKPELKLIYDEIVKLYPYFEFIAIRHVYREENSHADELTNEVLKSKSEFVRVFRTESSKNED
jgi:ribonuclease HI